MPDDAPPEDEPDEGGEITPLFGEQPVPVFGVIEVGKTWFRDNLSVCWMPDVIASELPQVPTLRGAAENVVMKEWNRVGRIRFTNKPWPACGANSTADIRIGMDHRANVAGESQLGTDSLTVPVGQPTMTLNFGELTIPCDGNPDDDCPLPGPGGSPTQAGPSIAAFQHTTLHEFGHALGFRHEQAHEQETCEPHEELLDFTSQGQLFDGQSFFAYDPNSVMNYCSSATALTTGDIKVLHTLYPGVVGLYANPSFVHGPSGLGQPLLLGPGYYTTATIPSLNTMSSIVVPPGYQVRLCTTTTCTYATTNRQLPAPFDNAVVNVEVTPLVWGADLPGYQGIIEQFFGTRDGPSFAVVGDEHISSVLAAPTRVARVCTEVAGGGTCSGFFVGGSIPVGFKLNALLDNQVSHVEVTRRVVTNSGVFTGNSNALAVGVFKANGNAPFLLNVKSLAISGLEVRACTLEGIATPISPGGAGDCRIYTQSIDLTTTTQGPLRFLQVRVPIVIGP